MSLIIPDTSNRFTLGGMSVPFTLGLIVYPVTTVDQEISRDSVSGYNLAFYIWDGKFNLFNEGDFDIFSDLSVTANSWYFVGYSVDSDLRSCRMFASLLGSNSVEFKAGSSGTDLAVGSTIFSFSGLGGTNFNGNYGGIKYWDRALTNAQIQQEATQIRCFTDPYIWIPMTDYTSLAGQGRNLRGAGNSIGFTTGSISTLSPPISLGIPSIPFAPKSAVAPPYFASPLMLLAC
jgi:hypothetical protein